MKKSTITESQIVNAIKSMKQASIQLTFAEN